MKYFGLFLIVLGGMAIGYYMDTSILLKILIGSLIITGTMLYTKGK